MLFSNRFINFIDIQTSANTNSPQLFNNSISRTHITSNKERYPADTTSFFIQPPHILLGSIDGAGILPQKSAFDVNLN